MMEYGINRLGDGATIFEPVTLGFPSRSRMGDDAFPGTTIGRNAVLRSGTILYCDVTIGDDFSTGHNVLVREMTRIGDRVALGTATIVEGTCSIGSDVRIQSMVFIPTHTIVGDRVFIGPNVVLTNDRYPPFGRPELRGPTLENDATIGANSTILPGITIGGGALVAAGAVVTKNVPPRMLAIGAPARIRELPEGLL